MFFLLLVSAGKKSLYKSPPPGTVAVNDTFFVDYAPVRIIDYIEFLSSIRNFYTPAFSDSIKKLPKWGYTFDEFRRLDAYFKGDTVFYQKMLPRSLVTLANDKKVYDIDFRFKSMKYANFPIVNMSYEQAREYCKWRTDMVMLKYAVDCKTEKQRRQYPMNFKYRLPTRKEWEFILGEFFDQVNHSKFKKDPNRPPNIVQPYDIKKTNRFYYETQNAGELLDNAIISSDFMWTGGVGTISYQQYSNPVDWLSFRCVVQILPEDSTNAAAAPVLSTVKKSN